MRLWRKTVGRVLWKRVGYCSLWFVSRANEWIFVVKKGEKECRDGEDSRRMKLERFSESEERLGGKSNTVIVNRHL